MKQTKTITCTKSGRTFKLTYENDRTQVYCPEVDRAEFVINRVAGKLFVRDQLYGRSIALWLIDEARKFHADCYKAEQATVKVEVELTFAYCDVDMILVRCGNRPLGFVYPDGVQPLSPAIVEAARRWSEL